MTRTKYHAQLKVLPIFVWVGGLAIGWLLGLVQPFLFLQGITKLYTWLVFVGVGLFIGGHAVALMLIAKTSPNPYRPTRTVVQRGPFRFTHNPLYLSVMFYYVGIAVAFGVPWAVLLLPLVVWLTTL